MSIQIKASAVGVSVPSVALGIGVDLGFLPGPRQLPERNIGGWALALNLKNELRVTALASATRQLEIILPSGEKIFYSQDSSANAAPGFLGSTEQNLITEISQLIFGVIDDVFNLLGAPLCGLRATYRLAALPSAALGGYESLIVAAALAAKGLLSHADLVDENQLLQMFAKRSANLAVCAVQLRGGGGLAAGVLASDGSKLEHFQWAAVNCVDLDFTLLIPPNLELGDFSCLWPADIGRQKKWDLPAVAQSVQRAVLFRESFYDTDFIGSTGEPSIREELANSPVVTRVGMSVNLDDNSLGSEKVTSHNQFDCSGFSASLPHYSEVILSAPGLPEFSRVTGQIFTALQAADWPVVLCGGGPALLVLSKLDSQTSAVIVQRGWQVLNLQTGQAANMRVVSVN